MGSGFLCKRQTLGKALHCHVKQQTAQGKHSSLFAHSSEG